MFESIVHRLLDHPKRAYIALGITALILLVFGLPAVDTYFAAMERRQELLTTLEDSDASELQLSKYDKKATELKVELSELARKAVSQESAPQFREELEQMVRETGCTMRRVRLADAVLREWFEKDDPLEQTPRTGNDKKTPFKLRTQTLNLTVAGPLPQVIELLARLDAMGRISETSNVSLQRSKEDPNLVELDMELLLFDLASGSGVSA